MPLQYINIFTKCLFCLRPLLRPKLLRVTKYTSRHAKVEQVILISFSHARYHTLFKIKPFVSFYQI